MGLKEIHSRGSQTGVVVAVDHVPNTVLLVVEGEIVPIKGEPIELKYGSAKVLADESAVVFE